jgi:hypothetical protein
MARKFDVARAHKLLTSYKVCQSKDIGLKTCFFSLFSNHLRSLILLLDNSNLLASVS